MVTLFIHVKSYCGLTWSMMKCVHKWESHKQGHIVPRQGTSHLKLRCQEMYSLKAVNLRISLVQVEMRSLEIFKMEVDTYLNDKGIEGL